MIDAVIWDIGNVLLEWHPERHYDRRFGEQRRREVFDAVDLHAMNLRVDRGANMEEEVRALARANPDFFDEIMEWHGGWLEMASPPITHSVMLLKEVRSKGVPCYALSNFGRETFEFAETQYPFLAEFDGRVISAHHGTVKPEVGIYEKIEEMAGVAPGDLLFTDDNPANIEAAKARGWQTHLFEGSEGWAARLVEEGILSAEEAEKR